MHPFPDGVVALRPRLPHWWDAAKREEALRSLLDEFLRARREVHPVLWFYTPAMYPFARHVTASAVVYDCMDELSAFRFAPPELGRLEVELMQRADVVFTGGHSLYEAKAHAHDNIHPFPSAVDVAHFVAARAPAQTPGAPVQAPGAALGASAQAPGTSPAGPEPEDQRSIPHPRLGFCGVIDERMDLGLLAALAAARPDWHFVMVGPVVKIDPAILPRAPNLHFLGAKPYAELPRHLAGWDVGLMPFARSAATRFLSPTKTPEYLAAGLPVVSTPIVDVARHYGDLDGVAIAEGTDAFLAACERALRWAADPAPWRAAVDARLAEISWDRTFQRMALLLDDALARRRGNDAFGEAPGPGGRLRPAPGLGTAVERAADPTRGPIGRAPAVTRPTPALTATATPTGTPTPALTPTGTRPFRPAIRPAARRKGFDVLIVGAGFAGSVLAERLAAGSGKRVLLIDRLPHIAGNAFDHRDEAGILVHKYGPHIFHTNSAEVFAYLSRFTRWRPYEHRVLARARGMLVPMPINRTTLNALYGLDLTTDDMAADFLRARAEPVAEISNSRDVVVSQVGHDLYRTFFEGYTRKQWGVDPSALDKSVTARVPTRTGTDDRYFLDAHQAMPAAGYTRMFENMLDHDGIRVETGVDFRDLAREGVADRTIFTGPIDEYFGHRFGSLPYRSLTFRHETHDRRRFQPAAVVNYPSADVPYTRITEYKYLTGQVHPRTSISYEFAGSEGDPYYPVPAPENQALYRRYEDLAASHPDVTFAGRLGSYRYYNMDQVVGQALATYRRMSAASAAEPRRAVASGIALAGD